MKKYGLFLMTVFLIWLFWFSASFLNFKRQELVQGKYVVSSLDLLKVSVPILINTKTGQSWRYILRIGQSKYDWVPMLRKDGQVE